MAPPTRYAKSGNVNIAYSVTGDAALDLVLVPGFVSHLELYWADPNLAHFLTRLCSFARLILFDKRGTGMSDPVAETPSLEERMDDIRAVMDAVGSSRAAIFGISEGGTLGLLFAHLHPDRLQALVLYGSWSRRTWAPDYPWGLKPDELDEFLERVEQSWATGEWWTATPFDDEHHRELWAMFLRLAASPSMGRSIIRMNAEIDLRDLLSSITVPTLILHRTGDLWIEVAHARYMAERIPDAVYRELPGSDHRFWLEDTEEMLGHIEVFLTGKKRRPRRRVPTGPRALSRREREVALLASRGSTAPLIAKRLGISERTVETHLVSVYGKLGVSSKAELISRARSLGL